MTNDRLRRRPGRRQAARSHTARAWVRRGLTLVELLIVVLLMGILAAVAAPRFAQLSTKYRTEAVARRIAADLNFARRTAVLNSKTVSVTFATSPPGYQMTGVAHPDHPSQSYTVSLPDLDADATIQSATFNSASSLTFSAQGPPQAGSPLVTLTSGSVVVKCGSEQETISIDPATGKATVP